MAAAHMRRRWCGTPRPKADRTSPLSFSAAVVAQADASSRGSGRLQGPGTVRLPPSPGNGSGIPGQDIERQGPNLRIRTPGSVPRRRRGRVCGQTRPGGVRGEAYFPGRVLEAMRSSTAAVPGMRPDRCGGEMAARRTSGSVGSGECRSRRPPLRGSLPRIRSAPGNPPGDTTTILRAIRGVSGTGPQSMARTPRRKQALRHTCGEGRLLRLRCLCIACRGAAAHGGVVEGQSGNDRGPGGRMRDRSGSER